MTISNSEALISGPYAGNGATTVFDYDFKIYNSAELRVERTLAGVRVVLALTTDYTVAGVGDAGGGSITLVNADRMPTGAVMYILPDIQITQTRPFGSQSSISLNEIEVALDKNTSIDRQLKGAVDRAIRLPAGSTASPDLPILQEGRTLLWGAAGLENGPTPGDITTAVASAAAAAADADQTAFDRIAVAADLVLTDADTVATAADRVQTGLDRTAVAADLVLTDADTVATAADRVQTGLDRTQTVADRVQTGLDRTAAEASAVASAADAVQTALDRTAVAADLVLTDADTVATAADRVQTGLDRAATEAYVSGSGVLLAVNNLSDILNPSTARTNLGLVPQTTPMDTIAGRLLTSGAFGLGQNGAGPLLANLNAFGNPGSLALFDATTTGTKPSGVTAGTVLTVRGSAGGNISQFVVSNDGLTSWFRALVAGVWGAWNYSISNLDKASGANAIAGTDDEKYLTSLKLRNGLNASGAAPVYGCRAWVNFDGTGVVAIRASGNVSSITDNGTGNYTANFATNMPDADYCVIGTGGGTFADTSIIVVTVQTVSAVSFRIFTDDGVLADRARINIAIFR